MSDNEIKDFALNFRKGVLSDRNGFSMCWVVVQPLSLLLNEIGVKNNIVCFDIDANNCVNKLDCDLIEHFCIEINGKILDPTADQFKGMETVFFGNRPIWYLEQTKNER